MNMRMWMMAAVVATIVPASAMAEEYVLTLKGDAFIPSEIAIPANTRVKLVVKNDNAKPAEFESHSMKLEKIIVGNSTATLNVRPLKAGTYKFFDEFNMKAKGKVVVK